MRAARVMAMAGLLAATASFAGAYSYFVFFPNNSAPFTPLPGRFDLNALPDKTVSYFISEQGPAPVMGGDSATAIYQQIQQAAQAWNSVPGSAIRLRFGGIRRLGTPQTVPGIDVVFDDDMPPGIIAQTKPTFPSDLSFLANKGVAFVPLLRSTLQLRRDLTVAAYAQSSHSDAFFTTLVHEFGHTLGLQHTLTSSVMSTAITRATTKGMPLAADDVAGISLLYPAGGYVAGTGSITGSVTLGGAGVSLASVVALSANGTAVSGLSNPDGTYRIDGVPPGSYYVYAHPLPPAQAGETTPANVAAPVDPQNDNFAANTRFATQFFPGTTDWTKANAVSVAAGTAVSQVNFAVAARAAGPAVYAMETYGYQNGIAIAAPPLPAGQRNGIVFYAPGTTVNQQTAIAPGLGVSVIGGAAQIEAGSLKYYTQGFLQMVLNTANATANLPVALAVTVNGDLYVLPAAFTVVPNAPPTVTGVVTQPSTWGLTLTLVTGTNLNAATRIQFDGAPVDTASTNADGSLTILVPPALSGQQAVVEALNGDGQTSLQAIGSAAPPVFTYPLRDAVTLAASPAAVIAGTDVMVAISGVNTHFVEGRTVVGFGSSDAAVRRVWVVNPELVYVNLTVSAGAQTGPLPMTASTGLEFVTMPDALNILAANPVQISLRVPAISALTGLAGVPAGGTILIATTGFDPAKLPDALNGWNLTIGGETAAFKSDKNGVLTATVPSDLAAGPQLVQLYAPANLKGVSVPPVVLQLDVPPPTVVSAADVSGPAIGGVPVSASAPAKLGDTVSLTVAALADANGILPAAGSLWIAMGGGSYPVTSVTPLPPLPNSSLVLSQVQFVLPATVAIDPAVSAPHGDLMVGTGTRLSAAFPLYIAPAAAP